VKVVWTTQNIIDDHMKKLQLVIALKYHTLMWYIKYCTDNPMASLVDTQTDLDNEFSRPKFETHSVVGLKEIVMRINETPWEMDQRLK